MLVPANPYHGRLWTTMPPSQSLAESRAQCCD
jgi:hypothetical protein